MTLQETIQQRVGRGWLDLLVTVFDAGVAYGSGQIWQPETGSASDLVETIKRQWHQECAAGEAWVEKPAAAAPEWLSESQRAYAERIAALGDAAPPEARHA